MPTPPFYVGLDVGGSSMKAGVVDDHGQAFPSVSLPTEAQRGQEFGLERMCETIRAAVDAAGLSLAQITAIGVATPGTMDIPGGVILDPPNLKPWRNVPVRDHVHKAFQKPTAFQNDANAAALGLVGFLLFGPDALISGAAAQDIGGKVGRLHDGVSKGKECSGPVAAAH